MEHVAPSGPIYQAGTLSGNPLAVSAGLAMLRYIQANPAIYKQFDSMTAALASAAPKGVTVNRVGGMMTWFFTPAPVTDYDTAKHSETGRFRRYFHAMIERGIYLPPSQFEALFVSAVHSDEDIARTVQAARESFEIALG
jgi:glutamate-1-semialdehyde 2,1-aminomutase